MIENSDRIEIRFGDQGYRVTVVTYSNIIKRNYYVSTQSELQAVIKMLAEQQVRDKK